MSMVFYMSGEQAAVDYVRGLPEAVQQMVLSKMQTLAASISDRIKEKLSGEVLSVKTGRLRSSIYARVYDSPGKISMSVGSRGDVPYADLQEYGGTVHHPGAQVYWGMSPMPMTKRGVIQAFSRKTQAHDILIPTRSYVRSTLDEMMPSVDEGILDAVMEATVVSN